MGGFIFAAMIFPVAGSAAAPAVPPAIIEFLLPDNSRPAGVTAGPDGNIWFAE